MLFLTDLWKWTEFEIEIYMDVSCCRIIEPLTSRCSKFRFKPLANKIQHERLVEICQKENLKYSKEVRVHICGGDYVSSPRGTRM